MTQGPSIPHIARHLKGTHFPAGKQALVQQARANSADGPTLEILECIPDRDFDTLSEVMEAVGEIGHRGDGAER